MRTTTQTDSFVFMVENRILNNHPEKLTITRKDDDITIKGKMNTGVPWLFYKLGVLGYENGMLGNESRTTNDTFSIKFSPMKLKYEIGERLMYHDVEHTFSGIYGYPFIYIQPDEGEPIVVNIYDGCLRSI